MLDRSTSRTALALALCGMLVACSPAPRRRGEPAAHVLLVTVACLRADHTSAFLYRRPTTGDLLVDDAAQTPSIDRLAAEGVLFANAFAPSERPRPGLAAILGGAGPLATGVWDESDAPRAGRPLLAERLAASGFETRAFVTRVFADGWRRGFDGFEASETDDDTVRRATQWIASHSFSAGRSLLWLHLDGPASPHAPEPLDGVDYAALYDGPCGLYDGEVTRVNALVERVVRAYPPDAWRATLLVLAGTSGAPLGEPADALDDRLLRVPLFLRHPASLTGRRIFADVVELQDVAPTLLDWFELPPEEAWRGRSLRARPLEWLKRPLPPRPAVAVRDAEPSVYTVRDAQWRLVARRGEPAVLFDAGSDRRFERDLAGEEPAVVRRLQESFEEWMREQTR